MRPGECTDTYGSEGLLSIAISRVLVIINTHTHKDRDVPSLLDEAPPDTTATTADKTTVPTTTGTAFIPSLTPPSPSPLPAGNVFARHRTTSGLLEDLVEIQVEGDVGGDTGGR